MAAVPATTVARKGKSTTNIQTNGIMLISFASHNKADCPNPRVQKCRHCNEEGHMVRDCPTAPPREFTGECHHCHEEGHMAKDCPTKPAEVCRNCQQEGKYCCMRFLVWSSLRDEHNQAILSSSARIHEKSTVLMSRRSMPRLRGASSLREFKRTTWTMSKKLSNNTSRHAPTQPISS